MRTFIRSTVVLLSMMMTIPAFAQWHEGASTTRIETRPFYGATVTIEHGVRVMRALPPTRHMIINPHGQTPLQLGINDTRIYEKSESENHFYDHTSGSSAPFAGGIVGGPFYGYGRRGYHDGKRFKRPGGSALGGRRSQNSYGPAFRPLKRGGHH